MHLPDLSGLEVLSRLRGQGHRCAVVMVTAERGSEAVRTALHGGAQHYLVKPFAQDDLAERLQGVATTLASLAGDGGDGSEGAEGGTEIDQATIDAAFGAGGARVVPERLPKGLSGETADLVMAALEALGECSASEVGSRAGLSRVTARRYLEHFVRAGTALVRLQYGTTGRPERRYHRR